MHPFLACFVVVCVSLASVRTVAQSGTLRERVAQEQADVALTINVDGPAPSMDAVLRQTDLIVRGVIGPMMGHLTDDGRDIYSTWEVTPREVFFSSTVEQLALSGSAKPIVVRQRGGTVRIGGFAATVLYDDTPKVLTNRDAVLLLRRDGAGVFSIAGGSGIFEVRDGAVIPSARRRGEHQQSAGMKVDQFTQEIVARRRELVER